jgi:hypothetical protein
MTLQVALAFGFGLLIGSFTNVLIPSAAHDADE